MKCKYWDRLPGQYDEQCQCGGELSKSTDRALLEEAVRFLERDLCGDVQGNEEIIEFLARAKERLG